MSNFAIGITATVPVVAHVKDGNLFCNAANGFVLWLVDDATGTRHKLSEGDGPVNKPFVFDVPDGSHLELDAKP